MRRVTPSLVIAVLALVLACSGGAFAASTLITGKQIKNSSITGADVKNKSLTPSDFKGSVKGDDGARGPQGPAGPAGLPGAQGAQGAAGTLASTTVVKGPDVPSGASGSGTNVQASTATCPAGTVVTGGGWDTGVRDFIANANPSGNGYFVIAVNTGSLTSHIQAYAVCGQASGAAPRAVAARAGHVAAERARLLKDARAQALAASCKKATIGGKSKCIQRGQFCTRAYQRDYKRYGFSCSKRDASGRYHLQ